MDTLTTATDTTPRLRDIVERLCGPGNFGTMEDRTITHVVDLHISDSTATQLQLTVKHNKEKRRFDAILAVVGVIDRGTCTVTVSTPANRERARRLPSKDVSRYSATSLMAFRSETALMLLSDPTWVDLDLSPWGPRD